MVLCGGFDQVDAETARVAQASLALHATQSRLIALERSSAALRELLRQRLGQTGVLALAAALQNMGAGTAALLEKLDVPSTALSGVEEGKDVNRFEGQGLGSRGHEGEDEERKAEWSASGGMLPKISTKYTKSIENALYY
jgi:hypothetical protein